MDTSVYVTDDEDAKAVKARLGDLGSETWGDIKVGAKALRHLIARDPLAADVTVTFFASAVFSYRYAAVARPLPAEYDCQGGIVRLTEALDAVPTLRSLLDGGRAVELASHSALCLLLWLLTPPRVPGGPGAVLRALPRPPPTPNCAPPDYLFEVDNPSLEEKWRSLARGKKTLVAFLGQPLDAFHSIVHRGILAEDDVRLKRSLCEALQMSTPGYGLGSSELGARLQCVAELEVIVDKGLLVAPDCDDFLLRDGRLARASRIYVFKTTAAIATTAAGQPSDKHQAAAAVLSRVSVFPGDSLGTSLPQFRFQVDTPLAREKRARHKHAEGKKKRYDLDDNPQVSSQLYEQQDERLRRQSGCQGTCFCGENETPLLSPEKLLRYYGLERHSEIESDRSPPATSQHPYPTTPSSPSPLSPSVPKTSYSLQTPMSPNTSTYSGSTSLSSEESAESSITSEDAGKKQHTVEHSSLVNSQESTSYRTNEYTGSTVSPRLSLDSMASVGTNVAEEGPKPYKGIVSQIQPLTPLKLNPKSKWHLSDGDLTYWDAYWREWRETGKLRKYSNDRRRGQHGKESSEESGQVSSSVTHQSSSTRNESVIEKKNHDDQKTITPEEVQIVEENTSAFDTKPQEKALQEQHAVEKENDEAEDARHSSPSLSWMEGETESQTRIWEEARKQEHGQHFIEDLEESVTSVRSYTNISEESEELQQEFEESLIEPIFHSQAQRDRRGKRLLILLIHSTHPDEA